MDRSFFDRQFNVGSEVKKMVSGEIDRLEAAHRQADAERSAAFDAVAELDDALKESRADLREKQIWLRAWLGDDAAKSWFADSAEFATLDVDKLQREISALHGKIHGKEIALTAAKVPLEEAQKVEAQAYYAMVRFRHRAAVAESIKTQIGMYATLLEEKSVRNALTQREGVYLGSLPIFALPNWSLFDITDSQSGICYRVREAVAAGYLSGEEEFLEGVAWRDSSVNTISILRS